MEHSKAQKLIGDLGRMWNELDPVDDWRPVLNEACAELRRLSAIEAERGALRAEVERLRAAPAPVAQTSEFEAWYATVVKYVEPADIAAWMHDAWDAGRASAPAPVALTPAQQHADELLFIARRVMDAAQNRKDKDWALMHLDISEASESAATVIAKIEATGQEGGAA